MPSHLNKCYGMLNHVLALVPLRKLSTFLKWPHQCPLNLKNKILALLSIELACFTDSGKVFHTLAAATLNDLSPHCVFAVFC